MDPDLKPPRKQVRQPISWGTYMYVCGMLTLVLTMNTSDEARMDCAMRPGPCLVAILGWPFIVPLATLLSLGD